MPPYRFCASYCAKCNQPMYREDHDLGMFHWECRSAGQRIRRNALDQRFLLKWLRDSPTLEEWGD